MGQKNVTPVYYYCENVEKDEELGQVLDMLPLSLREQLLALTKKDEYFSELETNIQDLFELHYDVIMNNILQKNDISKHMAAYNMNLVRELSYSTDGLKEYFRLVDEKRLRYELIDILRKYTRNFIVLPENHQDIKVCIGKDFRKNINIEKAFEILYYTIESSEAEEQFNKDKLT